MCLAVSGRILRIATVASAQATAAVSAEALAEEVEDPLWRMAVVDFGGVLQQVSLACLPQARVGDQVLVHVGLALSLVDEEEG